MGLHRRHCCGHHLLDIQLLFQLIIRLKMSIPIPDILFLSDPNLMCSSNMSLDGFIGSNTCNIEQEYMAFSCSVSFHGSIPPQLMWSLLNDSQVFNESQCTRETNRINCTMTMKADPMYNGSVFMCQTTKVSRTKYNCSTSVIKVQCKYYRLSNFYCKCVAYFCQ